MVRFSLYSVGSHVMTAYAHVLNIAHDKPSSSPRARTRLFAAFLIFGLLNNGKWTPSIQTAWTG